MTFHIADSRITTLNMNGLYPQKIRRAEVLPDGSETVPLLYPSIFVRKIESGGGIITFNKEKYVWIHQND